MLRATVRSSVQNEFENSSPKQQFYSKSDTAGVPLMK